MNFTEKSEAYLHSKKILIRDAIMVLIPAVIAIACLIIAVMNIDLAPGSDYFKSAFMNFLAPLMLISVGSLAYQIVLVADIIRVVQSDVITKILLCLCAWCLWPLVFIAKLIVYCIRPKNKEYEY